MTISYLGELDVAGVVPGAAIAVDAGLAAGVAGLAPLNDQLAALTAYTPVPISFTAQIGIAQSMIDGLNAAITAGISPPDISAQLAVLTAAIAALQVIVDGINGQLSVLTALQTPLAAAGVHAYAYDGPVSDLGFELDAAVGGGVPGGSGGSQHANAVIMVTVIPATWDALGEIVKVEP